jgi:hypothetical protein
MGIVVIPFGYETLPSTSQADTIPICIEDCDKYGNPIARIWFEHGVAPIHTRILRMAQIHLGDVWRASELAEISLHKLWHRHGSEAGDTPWRRVWRQALWEARDLAAGDWRFRKNRLISRTLDELDRELGGPVLNPGDYHEVYVQRITVEKINSSLEEKGLEEIAQIHRLLLMGHTWSEVAGQLGTGTEESLKKKFQRSAKTLRASS